MAARHLVRLVGWMVGWSLASAGLVAALGPAWALVGAVTAIVVSLWLLLWLPRSAHAAFEVGRFPRAARRYRVLGVLAFTRVRERAALLSRAGCLLSAGRLDAAAQLHDAIDATSLDPGERAVWLNNRACAVLEAGQEATEALVLAEEAAVLRPDVPAVQHTRGLALIAIGRLDDAIGVLDAMRAGGELPVRLEAERCRDLARAWEAKGEAAYAEDYRERARRFAG